MKLQVRIIVEERCVSSSSICYELIDTTKSIVIRYLFGNIDVVNEFFCK